MNIEEAVEYLIEALSDTLKNSVPYKKTSESNSQVEYEFKVDGERYTASFAFIGDMAGLKEYEFAFIHEDSKNPEKNLSMNNASAGKSKDYVSKVFGTVYKILKSFIDSNKVILFSGDKKEKSRFRLYHRFTTMINRENSIPGFKSLKVPEGDFFVIFPKGKEQEVREELF